MSLCLQPFDLKNSGWPSDDTSVSPEGFGCNDNLLATPINKLTTIALNGTGAFDVLMRTVKLHLQEEYDEGRIVGKEYATVYIGAITAVLQTASQHLVNEQMAHKTSSEIGLIRQKTVTELTQTDDSIPQGLGFNAIDSDDNFTIEPIVCSSCTS